MSFASGAFLLFLPLTVLLYWLCPAKWRYIVLLAASFGFYMGWSVPLTLILLGVTAVTWAGCLAVEKKKSRWVLAAVLCAAFAPLFICKYAGFLAFSLRSVSGWPGEGAADALQRIVLPVGISFYTFQAVSCVLDVRRGKMRAERNFFRFALFVSFFPQLVAGPIERAEDLMPQLRRERVFSSADFRAGLRLILTGFFRKICAADFLAPYVDAVFAHPAPDGSAAALGAVLFAFQIYFDFAGYSEIALGSARLMGIRLTPNFREPYLARGIRDFWRRWHITLNRWFRDYVYIPLGGGNKGAARRILASGAVFLLSGLWHGADWTFVLWGALHGAYYAAETLATRRGTKKKGRLGAAAQMALTFLSVCFAWILFRAESVKQAGDMYSALFSPWQWTALSESGMDLLALIRFFLLIPLTLLAGRWGYAASKEEGEARDLAVAALLTLAIALSWLGNLQSGAVNAFIYFQF